MDFQNPEPKFIRFLESDLKERRKPVKSANHSFDKGYIGSLTRDNEVWEFYSPLVTDEVRIEIGTPESKEEEEPIDQQWQDRQDSKE